MNIPSHILKYIIDFLSNRKFKVSIGDTLSDSGDILCSVPQGSVLEPILFLIPLADSKHVSYSSIFVDGFSTIFVYKYEWRLKMNASKCSYTIFSGKGSRNTTIFDMYINKGKIPYAPNPVLLGIKFDGLLNLEFIRRAW